MELSKSMEIIELRAKGNSFSKIAKQLGIGKQTAIDECKRNQERLAALYALEWEELLEKHRVTKQQRLQAHATLLSKLDDEIARRDLSQVSTEKLIELRIKQYTAIKEELVEPIFKSSEEQKRDQKEREFLDSFTPIDENQKETTFGRNRETSNIVNL